MALTIHPCTRKKRPKSTQVLVGTGFLALDLLYRNDATRADHSYAGGSFGNVMAILAFLGWKSYPVARLGSDDNAKQLIDDLQDFSVNTTFVRQMDTGTTPVIVVRVYETAEGTFKSKFEWKFPDSGNRLPSYRPLPQFIAREVSQELPQAKVFYFDRAEAASLLLAKQMRARGALVFFEPSNYKNLDLFTQCLAVSDIVKYSAQRIQEPPFTPDSDSPRLEIQTLGDQGLRFRMKLNSNKPGVWKCLPPYHVANLKDTTGCGDWCSAGLLHKIGTNGREGFLKLGQKEIINGLRVGQALSAINCEYEGARGPMYTLKIDVLLKKVDDLLKNQ